MDIDILYPAQPPSPPLLRAPTMDLNVPGSHTVTVPNTRQKSCNACVAGKRGCDKKQPTCSRCAGKKIACVYRRRRAPRRAGSDSDSDSAAAAPVPAPVAADAVVVDASATTVAPENTLLNHNTTNTTTSAQNNNNHQIQKHQTGNVDENGNHMLALQLQQHQHQHQHLVGGRDPLFDSVMDITLDELDTDSSPSTFGRHELSLMSGCNSPPSLLSATSDSSSYHSSSSSSSSASGSPPNPTMQFPSSELGFDEAMLDYSMLDVFPGLSSMQADSDAWLTQCHDFPDLPALEARQAMLQAEPCEVAIEQAKTCSGQPPFFQPWDIKDPRSRIGSMMQVIKEQPSIFAQTRSTPFISPELYRTRQPRAITHAWTACTVYAARTPATDAWATRVVVEGSSAVLRSPPLPVNEDPNAYTASGKVNTHALLDRLAAVQSLLLYQIIKCYDGDLMLASHADRDSPVLLEWTMELGKLRNELDREGFGGTVINTPSGQTIPQRAPVAWEDWVLMESVRRTVIKALCVVGTYECLKGRSPPCCMFDDLNVFTMSSHLWKADSSLNFYYAWRNKQQFRITKMQFNDSIAHADPDDVCDFGLAFLKTKLGVDATDNFMLRGSVNNELYAV